MIKVGLDKNLTSYHGKVLQGSKDYLSRIIYPDNGQQLER